MLSKPEKKKENKKKPENKEKKESKREFFSKYLNNQTFYYSICFLHHILSLITCYNKKLQDQHLEIDELKRLMHGCCKAIMDLVIDSPKMTKDLFIWSKEWDNEDIQKEYFKNNKIFLKSISQETDVKRFKGLCSLSESEADVFATTWKGFLKKIMVLLIEYLPLKDETIEFTDFVNLMHDFGSMKSKVLDFNTKYQIIEEENVPILLKELRNLDTIGFKYFKDQADNSIHIWDVVQEHKIKDEKFEFLPHLARVAHTLPTSSATIEQSFSVVKQVRTAVRNSLCEETLEGILFVMQEYQDQDSIDISDKMVELFCGVRDALNARKSGEATMNNQLVHFMRCFFNFL